MIELTNEQIAAVYKMENWWNLRTKQVFEISGGAGSGKTTLVNYMIDRLGLNPKKDVLFLCYCGKGASVMQRNGLPAQTIHSAIYNYVKTVERDSKGRAILNKDTTVKRVKEFELKDELDGDIKLIVIDEGSMVPKNIADDILSFGLPTIVLGDLNQLPPVFGDPYFLKDPDVILTQIMRQEANSPIIYLANEILQGRDVKFGEYGKSSVIRKQDFSIGKMVKADIILTGMNHTRHMVNEYFREKILGVPDKEYPYPGEKVICRKNNWDKCIGGMYLTNGMTGEITTVYPDRYTRNTLRFDFKAEFMKKPYKNLTVDWNRLMLPPDVVSPEIDQKRFYYNKFEYAYAITVHSSQGSQWDNIVFMDDNFGFGEDRKKFLYTAITRAAKTITIVR